MLKELDPTRIDTPAYVVDLGKLRRNVATLARVQFVPAPGSIRCSVRIGGKRYRDIRLTWDGSIARCFLRVPVGARGKQLVVGLVATLSGSRVRTTLAFRVS